MTENTLFSIRFWWLFVTQALLDIQVIAGSSVLHILGNPPVSFSAVLCHFRSHYVIAVDLDPKKLELAQHNAAIYGVADKIDFVKGDFFDLAHNLKVFSFNSSQFILILV